MLCGAPRSKDSPSLTYAFGPVGTHEAERTDDDVNDLSLALGGLCGLWLRTWQRHSGTDVRLNYIGTVRNQIE